MKMRIFLLAGSVLLTGLGRAEGQSTGQVYHVVREAMFTNAAACGYLDGLRAGNNFLCGVYAGTVSNALKPCFAWAHGSLVAPVRSNGVTFFHGYPVINATPGTPLLLQFRLWPAEFSSYEAAIAWSNPSPPVGMSAIFPDLGATWICEFPIEIGTIWLSPLATPGGTRGPLTCTLSASSIILSWPTNSAKWSVEGTGSLTTNALWSLLEGQVVIANGQNQLAVGLTNELQFFRLAR